MFSGWFEGESSSAADSWLPDDGSAVLEKRVTVLRLHVEDEDGAARYEHLELTVERFYELRHQLEAAKTQMELA